MTGKFEQCVELYRQSKDLKAVARDLGLPVIRVYLWLKTSGVLLREDSIAMGSAASRLGARAEQEFKSLVPTAKDMNCDVRQNHPGYDFEVNGQRIDVKAVSFYRRKDTKRKLHWNISAGTARNPREKGADVYVVFALLGKDLKHGYRLFAIPAELIGDRRYITITQGVPCDWDGFELKPDELSEFLHSLGNCPRIETKMEIVKSKTEVRHAIKLVRKLEQTIREKAA